MQGRLSAVLQSLHERLTKAGIELTITHDLAVRAAAFGALADKGQASLAAA